MVSERCLLHFGYSNYDRCLFNVPIPLLRSTNSFNFGCMLLYNSKTLAVCMLNNQKIVVNPCVHFAADEILKKPNYLVIFMGVTIRWTGPLDWNTGLDYWNATNALNGSTCACVYGTRRCARCLFIEHHGFQGELCIFSSL